MIYPILLWLLRTAALPRVDFKADRLLEHTAEQMSCTRNNTMLQSQIVGHLHVKCGWLQKPDRQDNCEPG